MKRKTLLLCSVFLLAALLLAFLPVQSGLAADTVWSFDEESGLLSVTGELPDFARFSKTPWYEHADEIYCVRLTGTETIGSYAFSELTQLKTLVFDSALREIRSTAFKNCGKLRHIYAIEADMEGLRISSTGNAPCLAVTPLVLTGAEELYDFRLGSCDGGTLIADTACYACAGDSVGISVLPDAGFMPQSVIVNGVSDTRFDRHVMPVSDSGVISVEGSCSAGTLYAPEACGSLGDSAVWQLFEDGQLVICGSGKMPEYSAANSTPWAEYAEDILCVRLFGMESAGRYAFSSLPQLKTLVFDSAMKEIRAYAFRECGKLRHIYAVGCDPEEIIVNGNGSAYYLAVTPQALGSSEDLYDFRLGSCSGGTLIADAACYTCAGDSVGISVLPDAGFLPQSVTVNGGPDTQPGSHIIPVSDSGAVLVEGSCSEETFCAAKAFGSCGDDSVWQLFEDGRLVVCGLSRMPDYSVSDNIPGTPWAEYAEEIRCVRLFGMESAGRNAFNGLKGLKTLVFDPELKEIGANAFKSCEKLRHIYAVGNDPEKIAVSDTGNTAYLAVTPRLLESPEALYRFSLGPCSGGTLIADTACHTCAGDSVGISVLPDAGFMPQGLSINGVPCTRLGSHIIPECDPGVIFIEGSCSEETLLSDKARGSCGDELAWQLLSDGRLVICGLGEPDAYSDAAKYPWFKYAEEIRSVIFRSELTEVPAQAFNSAAYTNLLSVVFREGVDAVGANVFKACPSLRFIEFFSDAPDIAAKAFSGSSVGAFALVYHEGTLGWPDPEDTTRRYASYPCFCYDYAPEDFSLLDAGCRNAQGILFRLDDKALTAWVGDDSNTKNCSCYPGGQNGVVVIPDSVIKDGKTYSVTYIAPRAFEGNLFLRELHIGKNIRDTADNAFQGCSSFSRFVVDKANISYTALDDILYSSDMNILCSAPAAKEFPGTYEVPGTVSRINPYAFYGCTGITALVVRTGVESIGDRAFENASGFRVINLENDVKYIGDYAFRGCTGLEFMYICSSVQSMGSQVLYNCPSLSRLTLPFLGRSPSGGRLRDVFSGSKSSGSSGVLNILTVDGGRLNSEAFMNFNTLTEVYLGRGITELPSSCFSGCSSLRVLNTTDDYFEQDSVEIPAGVTKIGREAFRDCTGVTRYAVEDGNDHYSADYWGVLYDADYKELLSYPSASDMQYCCVKSSTETVDDYAFCSCSHLITVYFPGLNTQLSRDAFVNSPSVKYCSRSGADIISTLGAENVLLIDKSDVSRMEIYKLADGLAFETGSHPSYRNLFLAARCSGFTVLLDESDYEIVVDYTTPGVREASVTCRYADKYGKPLVCSFRTAFFEKREGWAVAEEVLPATMADSGLNAFTAFYDFDGRMLPLTTTVLIDNATDPKLNSLHSAVYAPAERLSGGVRESKLLLTDGAVPLAGYEPRLHRWPAQPEEPEWDTDTGIMRWTGDSEPGVIYLVEVFRNEDSVRFLYDYTNESESALLADRLRVYGSGKYRFRVTPYLEGVPGLPADSEVWDYAVPDAELDAVTDVTLLPDLSVSWQEGGSEQPLRACLVTLWFRRWNGDEWRSVSSRLVTDGNSLCREIVGNMLGENERRVGQYAVSVSALSSDVTAAIHAPESEKSEAIYYEGR